MAQKQPKGAAKQDPSGPDAFLYSHYSVRVFYYVDMLNIT